MWPPQGFQGCWGLGGRRPGICTHAARAQLLVCGAAHAYGNAWAASPVHVCQGRGVCWHMSHARRFCLWARASAHKTTQNGHCFAPLKEEAVQKNVLAMEDNGMHT